MPNLSPPGGSYYFCVFSLAWFEFQKVCLGLCGSLAASAGLSELYNCEFCFLFLTGVLSVLNSFDY